jgi:exopolysaccharide production protein ExoQ
MAHTPGTSEMPRWYRAALTYFILSGYSAFGVIDRLIYGEWDGKPGDKITSGLAALVILSCAMMFAKGVEMAGRVRTGAISGFLLVALLFCSAIWSLDPAISLRWALMYLAILGGCISVAVRIDPDAFMGRLAVCGCLVAIACLLLFVVSPDSALSAEGDFRGIYSQKNPLGRAMIVGALACLHCLRARHGSRARNLIMLMTISALALLSKSATSCLTIVVFCGIDGLLVMSRGGALARMTAILLAFLMALVLTVIMAFPDALLDALGKDTSLTGRTDLWAAVIPYIFQHIWFGWGFFAFWLPNNPAAMEISSMLRWYVPQAHNGVLEWLINVGVIGTGIFLFLLIRTIVLSIRSMRGPSMTIGVSALFACVAIILNGVSESVLITPSEGLTIVFFTTGFYCERALRTTKRSI